MLRVLWSFRHLGVEKFPVAKYLATFAKETSTYRGFLWFSCVSPGFQRAGLLIPATLRSVGFPAILCLSLLLINLGGGLEPTWRLFPLTNWSMSTLDYQTPRLFNWGRVPLKYHEVSYDHYLGRTPLVNQLWFMNPGLTLASGVVNQW